MKNLEHDNWTTHTQNPDKYVRKMIWTSPEVMMEENGYRVLVGFRAYFKAPVTGKYRFI